MTDADAAVTAARRIGFPAVLKVVASDVPHKSEAGGVRIGQMVLDLADRIAEVDVNPLIVRDAGAGASAVDALVVLTPPADGGRP